MTTWSTVISQMPLIAILRGIEPASAAEIGTALADAGFRCAEIPLNSPHALQSIELLRAHVGDRMLVGAGTVLTVDQVHATQQSGAQFIVSPNTSAQVIAATRRQGLVSIPGFATASEAFAALEAGADALKLFPAEAASPTVLRALSAVLPTGCHVLPVGGVTPSAMRAYVEAGAAGFGIGSALYKPGLAADTVRSRAVEFVAAWNMLKATP